MGITGLAPKDPRTRARKNKDAITPTTIGFVKAKSKPLPNVKGIAWHPQTKLWWSNWRDSPLSQHLMQSDWDFLLETALLHSSYWFGDLSVAGELRQRVAKFGAAPEDRAKLRIQFADADKADNRKTRQSQGATLTKRKRPPLTLASLNSKSPKLKII